MKEKTMNLVGSKNLEGSSLLNLETAAKIAWSFVKLFWVTRGLKLTEVDEELFLPELAILLEGCKYVWDQSSWKKQVLKYKTLGTWKFN